MKQTQLMASSGGIPFTANCSSSECANKIMGILIRAELKAYGIELGAES
jgi:hypothetical protein